jgi:hypothetical protein
MMLAVASTHHNMLNTIIVGSVFFVEVQIRLALDSRAKM